MVDKGVPIMKKLRIPLLLVCGLCVFTGQPYVDRQAQAQIATLYFPQTGHTVKGRFLEYWETHGGLAQQGYPLSEEVQEESPTDGNVYTIQYFERAIFELHPNNKPPYDVLLSLLGVFEY